MLKVENLTKTYGKGDSRVDALRGISFTVNDGEMVAVMGRSGAGKSTLLNILGCMDTPTGGSYTLDGIEVNKLSAKERNRFRRDHVGFVFQNFALMGQYSLLENVELPLVAKDVRKAERRRIAMDALKSVGLTGKADRNPARVSGGQQQRAAIARAIAGGNNLILADEPTGALDYSTGAEVMELFRDLQKSGKTIVIVTHEKEIADKCDRILYISDGKVSETL
ncbi:MAG: ABC transporter ATP-binding protein [Lachnospiraceae bacterium]|nr:ABC transporter ATP-binding protein [Lachnospiraceae bacterium]